MPCDRLTFEQSWTPGQKEGFVCLTFFHRCCGMSPELSECPLHSSEGQNLTC